MKSSDEMDEMDDKGVLEAARAIRPYLASLVGPAADQLDRRIAELLNAAGRDEQVTAAVRSLLSSNETTGGFLDEVLADAPHHRPPELQPGNLRGVDIRLAGEVGPVLHAGKFTCPTQGSCKVSFTPPDLRLWRPAAGLRPHEQPLCPPPAW